MECTQKRFQKNASRLKKSDKHEFIELNQEAYGRTDASKYSDLGVCETSNVSLSERKGQSHLSSLSLKTNVSGNHDNLVEVKRGIQIRRAISDSELSVPSLTSTLYNEVMKARTLKINQKRSQSAVQRLSRRKKLERPVLENAIHDKSSISRVISGVTFSDLDESISTNKNNLRTRVAVTSTIAIASIPVTVFYFLLQKYVGENNQTIVEVYRFVNSLLYLCGSLVNLIVTRKIFEIDYEDFRGEKMYCCGKIIDLADVLYVIIALSIFGWSVYEMKESGVKNFFFEEYRS